MSEERSKQALVQNILMIVLTILVIALGALYFIEKKKNIEQVEINVDLTGARDSLELRLVDMISEYETLKTNNDEINIQLLSEKERVKELLSRLRNERSYSHAKFAEYEKELGTLRKIMRSYIVQIDSLNQSNIALRSENKNVRRQIREVETERNEIEKRFEEAAEKVDIASVLRPINISAEGISSRGRSVSRARNIEKIKICFTLDENPIAKAGPRFVYIRVLDPNGVGITNPEQDTIQIAEKPIIYSARREIDYQNAALDICVFVDAMGDVSKGLYAFEIYIDNRHIGDGDVTFK